MKTIHSPGVVPTFAIGFSVATSDSVPASVWVGLPGGVGFPNVWTFIDEASPDDSDYASQGLGNGGGAVGFRFGVPPPGAAAVTYSVRLRTMGGTGVWSAISHLFRGGTSVHPAETEPFLSIGLAFVTFTYSLTAPEIVTMYGAAGEMDLLINSSGGPGTDALEMSWAQIAYYPMTPSPIQRGIIDPQAGASGATEFPLGTGVGFATPGVSLPGLAVPANALLVVGVGVTTTDPGMPANQTTALWGATLLAGTVEHTDGVGVFRLQVFVRRTLVPETRTLVVENLDPTADQVFAIASYMVGPSSLNAEGDNGGGASPGDLVVALGGAEWAACYLWAAGAVGDPGPWLSPARTLGQGVDLPSGPAPGWVSEAFLGPGPLGVTNARKTLNPPASGAWFGMWVSLP